MISKRNVLKWFQDLSAYKRVDIITSLLRMYVPLELQLLNTNLKVSLRGDVVGLEPNEELANSVHELHRELSISSYGIFDIQIRHKLTTFIALVKPDNRHCAQWIFTNFLQTPCAWINGSIYIIGSTLDLLDELLLLFIVAHNHPAFRYKDKIELARTIARLEKEYFHLVGNKNPTYELFFTETTAATKINGKMLHTLNTPNISKIRETEEHLKCPPGLAFSSSASDSAEPTVSATDPKDQQQPAGSSSKDVTSTTEELQIPPSSFYYKPVSFEELASRTTIHPGHTPSPEPSGDTQLPDDYYFDPSAADKPEYRNVPQSNYDDNLASSSNQNVAETQRISDWVETGYPKTSVDQYITQVQRLRLDDANSTGGQSWRSNTSNSSRAGSHTIVYDLSGLSYARSTTTATVSATASLSDSETKTTASQRVTPARTVTFAETVASPPRGSRVQSQGPEEGPSSKARSRESTGNIPQPQSSQQQQQQQQPHQQHFVPQQPHFMLPTFQQPTAYSQPMQAGSTAQPVVFTNPAGLSFMSSGAVPYQMIVYPNAAMTQPQTSNYQAQSSQMRSQYYVQSPSGEILLNYAGLQSYYPTLYPNVVPAQQSSTSQRLHCWNCGSNSHSPGECDASPVDQSSSAAGSGFAQQRFRPTPPVSNTVPVTTSAPQSAQSSTSSAFPSTSGYVPSQSFSSQTYTSSHPSSQPPPQSK